MDGEALAVHRERLLPLPAVSVHQPEIAGSAGDLRFFAAMLRSAVGV